VAVTQLVSNIMYIATQKLTFNYLLVTEISDCNDLRCTGAGTCTQTLPGQLLCECDSMYEGDQCESVIRMLYITCFLFYHVYVLDM